MFRLSLLSNYSQFSVPFTIRNDNWLEFGLLIACLVHVIQSVSAAGFIVSAAWAGNGCDMRHQRRPLCRALEVGRLLILRIEFIFVGTDYNRVQGLQVICRQTCPREAAGPSQPNSPITQLIP